MLTKEQIEEIKQAVDECDYDRSDVKALLQHIEELEQRLQTMRDMASMSAKRSHADDNSDYE
jgi:predicted DNA binding CopG/RHH family protein